MRSFTSWRQPANFVRIAQFHTTPPLARGRNDNARRRRVGAVNLRRQTVRRPLPVPSGGIGFQASNTLLDLDAHDSPHVRPYDDGDEAEQQRKWDVDPAREELEDMYGSKRSSIFAAHREHARVTSPEATGKWRVDDMDILTAALRSPRAFDHPLYNANSPKEKLNLAMRRNGIPTGLGVDNISLLEWLIRRQNEVAPCVTPDVELVQFTLRDYCRKWSQKRYQGWSRFLFWVLRMDEGPTVLNDCQDIIYEAMIGSSSARVSSLEILTQLNNFAIRLEEAGFRLSPALTRLGLVLAADVGHPEAVDRYQGDFERVRWAVAKDSELEYVEVLGQALIRDRDERILVVDSIQAVTALMERISQRQQTTQPLDEPTMGTRGG